VAQKLLKAGTVLDALTAEKVFVWKNVHKHNGTLYGKSRTKQGDGEKPKCRNIRLIQSRPTQ
jgi:hypothetical protein